MRGGGEIQFAPLPPHAPPAPAPPPDWLVAFGRWLADLFNPVVQALGTGWPMVKMGAAVLGAALVLAVIWYLARPLIGPRIGKPRQPAAKAEWQPEPQAAQALLADADALAGQGRYDEAAHLLLRRSVQHIAEARPDWLHPASTAREIAALPAFSATARMAFATIATLVERSRYGLHPLGQADWHVARTAYAGFAAGPIAAPA